MSVSDMDNISELEKKLGVKFNNSELLSQALIHRSYINEHPGLKMGHNERLEFLGDAVLELITTEFLYSNYTNPEGELTNWRSALVRGQHLAEIAAKLELGDYLQLSRGESKSGGKSRQILLANAMEAVIGAMYLDLGYDVAKEFISKNILSQLPSILENEKHIDPKSHLQEITQEKFGVTPHYEVTGENGPDHAKTFTVAVFLDKELLASANGSSKQQAEQEAAIQALTMDKIKV